jgi:hypothetical protein
MSRNERMTVRLFASPAQSSGWIAAEQAEVYGGRMKPRVLDRLYPWP